MIPLPTAQKLAKLIPLLASDQGGEVVATARAIGRSLSAAGLDLHALAAFIEETSARAAEAARSPLDNIDFNAIFAQWDQEKAEKAPAAPSKRGGLPIWGTSQIASWDQVVEHCLALDWAIPKVEGGRFLSKADRARLKIFRSWRNRPTNADAEWIEGVLNRCHEVRDAWRNRKTAA
ncbi:hypothetical protein [Methylobacterium sp. ID0610]|uniref:hypothetical protein n=1 Tax=Methylobacterium carpenticola TaxID=3344827 RepID=UPI0036C1F4B6